MKSNNTVAGTRLAAARTTIQDSMRGLRAGVGSMSHSLKVRMAGLNPGHGEGVGGWMRGVK